MTRARALDLTGQTFGRLTVVGRSKVVHLGSHHNVFWVCRCDCGATKDVSASCLRRGLTRSCGCLRAECARLNTRTHGQTRSPEWRVWVSMIARCTLPSRKCFHRYGGRGITVCDRWRESFVAFLSDMGPRPVGTTLDRIDNDGNYEPGNCRWATLREQASNTSHNRTITFGGETMIAIEWARRLGITQTSLNRRLAAWPLDRALTEPRHAHHWGDRSAATRRARSAA